MSTLIWPPAHAQQIQSEQAKCLDRELEWLLAALQDTLKSLKAGLEDCASLLAPSPVTLALSSHRAESLKGVITLSGTRVLKGDIHLRLPSLPPPRGSNTYKLSLSTSPSAPTIIIDQLTSTRTLINSCLDVVDATRWTGEADNAVYISSQLRLLHEYVLDARNSLAGGADLCKAWHDDPIDSKAFEPPLPPTIAVQLSIVDAALVLHVRTLEYIHTPGSSDSQTAGSIGFRGLRDRLVQALSDERKSTHDEAFKTFTYQGKPVKVIDKVAVESQHPSLMAVMAKMTALDHTIALNRRALDVLMNTGDQLET